MLNSFKEVGLRGLDIGRISAAVCLVRGAAGVIWRRLGIIYPTDALRAAAVIHCLQH